MNVDQEATEAIEALHRQIVKDLVVLEDEIASLNKRHEQMLAVVQNLEALYKGLPHYSDVGNGEDSPRGQDAVARVLSDTPDRWLSIKDLTTELQLRRWINRDAKNPEAAVRAALRRLIDSEASIRQRKDGRSVFYKWSQDSQPVTGASLASGGEGG